MDALGEELPDRPRGGEQRQRHEHARQPVDLAAREEPEDDEQRVQPQRPAHHVRDHDVTLDLVDEQEGQRDGDRSRGRLRQRHRHRRDRADPRPHVGDHLGQGGERACRPPEALIDHPLRSNRIVLDEDLERRPALL